MAVPKATLADRVNSGRVGALGLSLTRITGDGMANSGILSMGTSALAILTARKTEAAVLEDAAAEG